MQHIQQQRRNRERKQEQKATLKEVLGSRKVHVRHINEARCGWKIAQKELDILRLDRWQERVDNQPNPGAKKDQARECAQVPIKFYDLAQEFKENNPQVVIRVLEQNLPMIRDRIGKLDVQDDLISNFSFELDKLDDEGYQDRKAGLIKVSATTYERMKEELTKQDACEEELRLEYNQLERMYRKLKKQKTCLIKRETNEFIKEDASLTSKIARMESQLELLSTRLRE